jgi:hypothetical protein
MVIRSPCLSVISGLIFSIYGILTGVVSVSVGIRCGNRLKQLYLKLIIPCSAFFQPTVHSLVSSLFLIIYSTRLYTSYRLVSSIIEYDNIIYFL